MTEKLSIAPASGRLGVLTPGLGAVATTFIAGVIAARRGLAVPIGSVSQMAHIRLGRREEGRNPLIRDFVPLADLDDLVFGGWDPISSNVLEAARTCGVLEEKDIVVPLLQQTGTKLSTLQNNMLLMTYVLELHDCCIALFVNLLDACGFGAFVYLPSVQVSHKGLLRERLVAGPSSVTGVCHPQIMSSIPGGFRLHWST